jgi:hypothetical protein
MRAMTGRDEAFPFDIPADVLKALYHNTNPWGKDEALRICLSHTGLSPNPVLVFLISLLLEDQDLLYATQETTMFLLEHFALSAPDVVQGLAPFWE